MCFLLFFLKKHENTSISFYRLSFISTYIRCILTLSSLLPPSCPIIFVVVGSTQSPVSTACWNIPGSCWLDLVQVNIAAVRSPVWWPCHAQQIAFHSVPLHPPALTFFLFSFLCCSLSSSGGGGTMIHKSHLGLCSNQSFHEL